VQPQPTWGLYYWPVALTVVTAIIMGPEIYALVTNVANTLSWWVWGELHVHPGDHVAAWTAGRLLTFMAWCSLMFWLTWHFWFGLFR
jgi:hypothetical protein